MVAPAWLAARIERRSAGARVERVFRAGLQWRVLARGGPCEQWRRAVVRRAGGDPGGAARAAVELSHPAHDGTTVAGRGGGGDGSGDVFHAAVQRLFRPHDAQQRAAHRSQGSARAGDGRGVLGGDGLRDAAADAAGAVPHPPPAVAAGAGAATGVHAGDAAARRRCLAAVVPGFVQPDAQPQGNPLSRHARQSHRRPRTAGAAEPCRCAARGAVAGRRGCASRATGGTGRADTSAPAGTGDRRDGAGAELGAEWLRAADHAAACPARRGEFPRCERLRHQHGSVAAVHVLGVGAARLRRGEDPQPPVAAARAGAGRRHDAVARQSDRLQGCVSRSRFHLHARCAGQQRQRLVRRPALLR